MRQYWAGQDDRLQRKLRHFHASFALAYFMSRKFMKTRWECPEKTARSTPIAIRSSALDSGKHLVLSAPNSVLIIRTLDYYLFIRFAFASEMRLESINILWKPQHARAGPLETQDIEGSSGLSANETCSWNIHVAVKCSFWTLSRVLGLLVGFRLKPILELPFHLLAIPSLV